MPPNGCLQPRPTSSSSGAEVAWEGLAQRIDRLTTLSERIDRPHKLLEFGLRITTVVRDTTEEAWSYAEQKVEQMAADARELTWTGNRRAAVGQRRLLDLAARGEVLDTCLYTTPGKYGAGGAATTWLVGSADDVAAALENYRKLGITHFVLSETLYKREPRPHRRPIASAAPPLRAARIGLWRWRECCDCVRRPDAVEGIGWRFPAGDAAYRGRRRSRWRTAPRWR